MVFHADVAFVGFERFDEVQADVAEGGIERGEVEGGKRQEVVNAMGLVISAELYRMAISRRSITSRPMGWAYTSARVERAVK